MTLRDLYYILEQGVKAPSADNLQPWTFDLSDNGSVDLSLEASRITSYCDAGNLAPYIAAGAAIENMRVAATRTGQTLECRYFPEAANPLKVARITFRPGFPVESPLAACLDLRHTNRKFYDPSKPLETPELHQMERQIPSGEGFRLLWKKRTDPEYKALARMIGEADQLRFEIKRLHRELMEVIRFDSASIAKTRDGLPVPALEAGPTASMTFSMIRSWQRLSVLNRIGMSYSFNLYARMQMMSSAAAGLLVAEGSSANDYVRGGEIMERLWLEAARLGLSLQPMEALPIFILNSRLTGGADLNPAQRQKLQTLSENFSEIFGIGPQNALILLFRIGHAAPSENRSLRRPLESFLRRPVAASSKV